jgi:predicted PurR-regulated permease PerM
MDSAPARRPHGSGMDETALHQKVFLLLVLLVSLAFGWVLLPFFGAVFWAAVLAVVFTPVYRRLLRRWPQRHNLAAALTLLLCVLSVILPLAFLVNLLIREAGEVYTRLQSGQVNIRAWLAQALDYMPRWLVTLLERNGLTRLDSLQDKLTSALMQGSRGLVTQAVTVGQNTFSFLTSFVLMLYLLFFLLRDGAALALRIRHAIPLALRHKQRLLARFTAVIRATIKGSFVVAAVQGALGGIIFAVLGIEGAALWGAVMAFLSLLPAVGTALVWGPVALYLLFTGDIGKGLVLIAFGVLAIGLIDNVLRPLLVGKDTQMPDYVVLVSTLGGIVLFGISGLIIGPMIAALFIAAWDLFAPPEHALRPGQGPP